MHSRWWELREREKQKNRPKKGSGVILEFKQQMKNTPTNYNFKLIKWLSATFDWQWVGCDKARTCRSKALTLKIIFTIWVITTTTFTTTWLLSSATSCCCCCYWWLVGSPAVHLIINRLKTAVALYICLLSVEAERGGVAGKWYFWLKKKKGRWAGPAISSYNTKRREKP